MTAADREGPDHSKRQNEPLRALFDSLPDDPPARLAGLVTLNQAFREVMRQELQPVLDKLLRGVTPETPAGNQVLAAKINAALHETGTAILHPETGQPGSVVADRKRLVIQQRKKADDGSRPRSDPTPRLKNPLQVVQVPRQEVFARFHRDHRSAGRE